MGDDIDWIDDFAIVDDFYDNPNSETETDDNNTTTEGDEGSEESNIFLIPSTLSDNSERVLSILLVLSALLSAIGSASIVYKIIRDKQFSKPYHRTMLALSSSDVIASLTYGSYPFLMPRGVRIWTMGNRATCTALGFLSQYAFVAIGYNCILSFYYLLAIKYNMKRKQFVQKYERPMHAINVLYFAITATVGVVYQFYSPVDVGFGCWVNNWPPDCNLTGDCVSQQIAIVFAGIPVSFFFCAIVINHLLVYKYVRTVFRSLDKVYAAQEAQEREKANESYWDNKDQQGEPNKRQQQQQQHQQKGLTAKEAIAFRKSTVQSDLYEDKLQEVALQAFLYVGSFLICYTPALATRIVETLTYNYDDAKIYWLLVITAMTLPLQGFFNMFIYNRPHYVRIRESHPNLPVIKAMQAAFLESKSLALSSWQSDNGPSGGAGAGAGTRGGTGSGRLPRKRSSRFSHVGGSLEVVMEEIGSQMSEDDEDVDGSLEKDSASSSCEGTKKMDNTTTDNDSTTMNDTDENENDLGNVANAEYQGMVDDDGPILRSPVPSDNTSSTLGSSTIIDTSTLEPPVPADGSPPMSGRIDMTGTVTTQQLLVDTAEDGDGEIINTVK